MSKASFSASDPEICAFSTLCFCTHIGSGSGTNSTIGTTTQTASIPGLAQQGSDADKELSMCVLKWEPGCGL